jgi:hypothetical protein
MFVVTCPRCEKPLYLADTTRGKHVRCAGCQEIVLADTDPAVNATPPPRKASPSTVSKSIAPKPTAPEVASIPDAIPGLRCTSCEADAVLELPPDANSRKPGFVCAMCRSVMRPPGSMGNYYAAALLGTVIILLGLGLAVVALEAKQARGQMIGGGIAVAVLGGVVAGWAFKQTRGGPGRTVATRRRRLRADVPPARNDVAIRRIRRRGMSLPTGPQIILALKVLVTSVTVLFAASLVALLLKRPRLHGRINTAFFALTMLTVAGFEAVLQFVDVSAAFDDRTRQALRVHLWFAVPSALLLPVMLLTGRAGKKAAHVAFGSAFLVLWMGTFVTGVFFLPHTGAAP